MRAPWPGLRKCGLAVAVAAACTLPVQAQVTLDAKGLRTAATLALQSGDPQRARIYADALLVRDAQDIGALLLRARALRDLGAFEAARASARTAWALADTDAKRYSTAVITAQILSSQEKRTRAQLWLRRAVQNAPTPQAAAQAKRDFRYVQRRNKWQTQLSFTLAPNSNINNGSVRESSQLNYALTEALFGQPVEFALTGAARALSGLEYGFGVQSRYRVHQTEDTAHDLKLSLSYRSFVLSNEAQTIAPTASGSDFAFGSLGLGYDFRKLTHGGKGEFIATSSVGQMWYAGARYASFVRAGLSQSLRTDAQTQLRFAFDLEHQNGQRTPDLDTYSLSAQLTRQLSSGNTAFYQAGLKATQSANPDAEYAEVSVRAGYVLGKPVMGAAVQMGIGAAWRDYDVSVHSRDGREDVKLSADITATFTQIDYYGFNPTVSLSASTTNSNIGLFDSNRVGINFGIRSSF